MDWKWQQEKVLVLQESWSHIAQMAHLKIGDFLPLENDPLLYVRHAKQFTDPTTMWSNFQKTTQLRAQEDDAVGSRTEDK